MKKNEWVRHKILEDFSGYLKAKLTEMNVAYTEVGNKLIISDEMQCGDSQLPVTSSYLWQNPNDPLDFDVITEDCSLRKDLQKWSNFLEEEFGVHFECEYPCTFSIIIEA